MSVSLESKDRMSQRSEKKNVSFYSFMHIFEIALFFDLGYCKLQSFEPMHIVGAHMKPVGLHVANLHNRTFIFFVGLGQTGQFYIPKFKLLFQYHFYQSESFIIFFLMVCLHLLNSIQSLQRQSFKSCTSIYQFTKKLCLPYLIFHYLPTLRKILLTLRTY